jgi:hypothetical protein
VQWFHEDARVDVVGGGWYSVESQRGVHRLTIPSMRPADAGKWACLATSAYGTTTCTARITLLGECPRWQPSSTLYHPSLCFVVVFSDEQ